MMAAMVVKGRKKAATRVKWAISWPSVSACLASLVDTSASSTAMSLLMREWVRAMRDRTCWKSCTASEGGVVVLLAVSVAFVFVGRHKRRLRSSHWHSASLASSVYLPQRCFMVKMSWRKACSVCSFWPLRSSMNSTAASSHPMCHQRGAAQTL